MSLSLNKHEILGTLTFDQVDENWDDIQTLVNQINSRLPQNNWQATANPTTSSDQTQGYVAGSRWYNTSTGDLFICTNASTGAAVWVAETTLTFADVTLDAVTSAGNSTVNGIDVGAIRSSAWLGTVAATGLSAVVEYGSNANGQFWKYAGGMMVCASANRVFTRISGSQARCTWTYPAVFSGNPSVDFKLNAGIFFSAAWPYAQANSQMLDMVTTTSVRLEFWTSGTIPASPTEVGGAHAIAIGRWF